MCTLFRRGISVVQLATILGTTYKTAWYMLKRIHKAMGQRDATHQLDGVIDFDDAYFGGAVTGKKRDRGTEKVKVFVALSLNSQGNPRHLKCRPLPISSRLPSKNLLNPPQEIV